MIYKTNSDAFHMPFDFFLKYTVLVFQINKWTFFFHNINVGTINVQTKDFVTCFFHQKNCVICEEHLANKLENMYNLYKKYTNIHNNKPINYNKMTACKPS